MANKINYENKVAINVDAAIPAKNKVTASDLNEIKDAVNNLGEEVVDLRAEIEKGGDTLPIGSIVEWLGETPPDNWLICNGQTVLRADYPELFSLFGTKYGAGNGTTTFGLPNFQGRVVAGLNASNTSFNSIGKTGGSETHTHTTGDATLTIAQIPIHSFTIPHIDTMEPAYSISNGILTRVNKSTAGEGSYNAIGNRNAWQYQFGEGKSHNHGSTNTTSTLQPYITANYIVKAKMTVVTLAEVNNTLTSTSTDEALSAAQGKALNDKITTLTNTVNTNAQKNIMTAYLNGRQTLTTGSWTSANVTLDTKVSIGNKLTLYDGGIKVGIGVSKVLVSGMINTWDSTLTAKEGIIKKNTATVAFDALYTYGGGYQNQSGHGFGSKLVECAEGDIFRIAVGTGGASGEVKILGDSGSGTYLTVEVVE